MKLRKPSVWEVLYFLLFVLVACIFITRELPDRSKGSLIFQKVKSEFESIQMIPEAKSNGNTSIDKVDRALFGTYYICNLSQEEVLNYYNIELKKNGWKYIKNEKDVTLFGEHTGMRFYYRKNDNSEYITSIYFPNEKFFSDGKIIYDFLILVSSNVE